MTLTGSTPEEASFLRPRKRRPKVSVVGVIGELFITAGILVLLFLGWQLWLNDIIVGSQQAEVASQLSEEWENSTPADAPTSPVPVESADPGLNVEPATMVAPANAERFAVLIVPRWGADYARPIAQGVGVSDVLNKIGLGHYPSTQMPGEVGNFAIASHRMAYGGQLKDLHELQIGDHIYVETEAGWHSYVFRSLEYVLPTGVGVLDPVPQNPDVAPVDRLITLTTCNPFYSTAERLVGYGVYNAWYPRAGGPPAEIAGTPAAGGS
jgi:sortase A